MKKADPDQLDSIIDGALSRYGSTQPLDGIAQRVLNRIPAADPGHRTSKILAWALCCPLLIALVPMAISVWTSAVMKPAHIDFASLPQIAPAPSVWVNVPRAAPTARHRMTRKPLEAPISNDERTLLALAANHPAESQQIFAAMQRPIEEPVDIDEIEVTPLQIPEVH